MRTVCEKNMCAGCMACKDVCQKNAIHIDMDIEHYNAVIDEEVCVNCGACIRVCQQNNRKGLIAPIKWYQGWSNDTAMRNHCSSGGIACAVEKNFIKNGGVVYSCTFMDGHFGFQSAENEEEAKLFSGSKYVKSNAEGVYLKIRKDLQKGKKVLFVGLPCQVSALKNFITEEKQKELYTVDLICHGTPSPKMLDLYLKQYGFSLNSIQDLIFRTKNRFQLRAGFSPVEGVAGICDHYSTAFLNSICYTENCYLCNYATTARISDLTLGDSWGSNLSEDQKRKGISLVLCQSEKGASLIDNATIHLEPVDIENAIKSNHQLREPSEKPEKRDFFFKRIKDGKSFNSTVFLCYPWICVKQFAKRILLKARIIRWGGIGYSLSIRSSEARIEKSSNK